MKNVKADKRILKVAGDLFSKKGYGSVGINEIIAEADVAKATLYQNFASKEKLCSAWLEAVHEASLKNMKSILASGESPKKKIISYFEALSRWMKKTKFRGCPYTNTVMALQGGEDQLFDQVEDHKESIRGFMIDLSYEKLGKKMEAERLGTILFLLYSGATTEAQNLRQLWPVEASVIAVKDLLKNYKE